MGGWGKSLVLIPHPLSLIPPLALKRWWRVQETFGTLMQRFSAFEAGLAVAYMQPKCPSMASWKGLIKVVVTTVVVATERDAVPTLVMSALVGVQ